MNTTHFFTILAVTACSCLTLLDLRAQDAEIVLRTGETIYGRVLQEDGGWVVVDVAGGSIVSIERARVAEIRTPSKVSNPVAPAAGTASARDSGRSWMMSLGIVWGWSSGYVSSTMTVYDSGLGTTNRNRASADANGFDDAPGYFVRLSHESRFIGYSTLAGAQLVASNGDIINPDVPVWSLEGVLGLRFGTTTTFEILGALGPAFTAGDVAGRVLGSNGYEPYASTEAALGWVARLEGALTFAVGDATGLSLALGAYHRQLAADISYSTTTYSGEIDMSSRTTGVYLGLGLTIDL